MRAREANPPIDFIANPEGRDGFKWLRISAARDGGTRSPTVAMASPSIMQRICLSPASSLNPKMAIQVRFLLIGLIVALVAVAQAVNPVRPHARDLGVAPGVYPPGPLNAITDVADVRVGHVTIIEGDNIRTGVTVILPHGGNLFQDKVAGATFTGNAFGKLSGSTQVRELGTIETPIVLTNTLSVGMVMDAVVGWTLAQPGNEGVQSVNAVVGETNDGVLNDIRGMHVNRNHVLEAIRKAAGGPVEEGAVVRRHGNSLLRVERRDWNVLTQTSFALWRLHTLGVLVQTNYGGVLTMNGAPVGKELSRYAYNEASANGSCMIVVATDAPLDARDLGRVAARAVYGLARTGGSTNGSGSSAIAFTTSPALRVKHGERSARTRMILPTEAVSPLFEATLEATEEAVDNSLLRARTMTSRGKTIEALPIEQVKAILKKHGLG